jgi:hypothetical protein
MATAFEKMRCAERELVYRRRVYPRLVQKGRLTFERAKLQIELMEEIAADYRSLAEQEPMELFVETNRTVRQA